MPIIISVLKQYKKLHQPKVVEIKSWVRHAILKKYNNVSINIIIVNKEDSQRLNLQYRNKNNSTNVISLEYAETRDSFNILSGELILCDEVIVKEAIEQNKSIIAHYAHMIVHGILHIQGLDHQDENEAKYMESQEIKIMQQLQFPNPYIGETDV